MKAQIFVNHFLELSFIAVNNMNGKSEELKSKKSVISERYPTFYTAEIALPEVEDVSH